MVQSSLKARVERGRHRRHSPADLSSRKVIRIANTIIDALNVVGPLLDPGFALATLSLGRIFLKSTWVLAGNNP